MVHFRAGRIVIDENGETIIARRGLRPYQDVTRNRYELGRACVFSEGMRCQAYGR